MVDAYGELDVPKNKVTVLVVDNCGDTTVGIVLGVLGLLVLAAGEVEVDGLVGKTELLKNKDDLPVIGIVGQNSTCNTEHRNNY